MSRPVVPIRDMTRRIPEAGRIRLGVRSGRAMRALDTFRFTSGDKAALEAIAAIYGGEVEVWEDAKAADGQYEVITEASEIRVALPPDPLGGTPVYELWGGGGCERRCDGVTAQILTRGPDGTEVVDAACLCAARGEMVCEPRTRLAVILPEIRFGGVWRLESKSWTAAQELPGMVDLIQSVQTNGLVRGVLALTHRRSVTGGQTHRYVVPSLGLDETVDALATGPFRAVETTQPEALERPEVLESPTEPRFPPFTEADEVRDEPEELAPTGMHDIIREAIAGLPMSQRVELQVWWAEELFPSIKGHDSLTLSQAERVLDRLESLDAESG